MNILFVTGIYVKKNQPLSGMPGYIYKASKCLMERGHSPVIVTADARTYEWNHDGIPVYSVSSTTFQSKKAWIEYGVNAVLRDVALEKRVSEVCREKKIDIIQYTGWFGVGILKAGKVPAIMRMSSYAKVQLKYSYTEAQIKVISLLERLATKRMNMIIAPSYAIANPLSKDIGRKISVIETPFIEDCPREKWDDGVYEQKLKGKKYLFFFGRMSPDKGILTIAKALEEILTQHKELYFVFAGAPAEYEGINTMQILKEAAEKERGRLIFLGNLRHEVMLPVLENAHAVVMPSLMDNFPNACQEAMYYRKVVIGTDGSSIEQLIEDGLSGYLSIPGDGKNLAETIHKVMELSEKQIERIAENAYKRIAQLGPEITINKLEKVYQYVLKNSR